MTKKIPPSNRKVPSPLMASAGASVLTMTEARDQNIRQIGVPTFVPTGSAEIPAIAAPPARQTKAALLRDLVSAPGGATLTALIAATGWQAHTIRAALSGLRKTGLAVMRRREGEDTIYAIAAADTVRAAPSSSRTRKSESAA